MDQEVEKKLDNFEGVVSSFEEKKARGETISSEQIAILQTALFSIIAHHTIAKWWKDEMSERIESLTVTIGKFPAAKQEDDSDIIATFTWDALDEIEPDHCTGMPPTTKGLTAEDKKVRMHATPSGSSDWLYDLYRKRMGTDILC